MFFNFAPVSFLFFFFFFNDPATTEIYTLSLHDALPISRRDPMSPGRSPPPAAARIPTRDRKSTRLNSSHRTSSYAVFRLKKKKKKQKNNQNKKKTKKNINKPSHKQKI